MVYYVAIYKVYTYQTKEIDSLFAQLHLASKNSF